LQHIEEWVKTLDYNCLREAGNLIKEALSCGWTPINILNGVLSKKKEHWKSELHTIQTPTYYGMLVASFLPINAV